MGHFQMTLFNYSSTFCNFEQSEKQLMTSSDITRNINVNYVFVILHDLANNLHKIIILKMMTIYIVMIKVMELCKATH